MGESFNRLTVHRFKGPHRFLSNFFMIETMYDGKCYPSAEHAYQAAKTTDDRIRVEIQYAKGPATAKAIGRAIEDIRPDWEDIKLQVMEDIVRSKFKNHTVREHLLATGDALLIEGNDWWDTFWGVCEGVGENHLGRILMRIREEIKLGKQ